MIIKEIANRRSVREYKTDEVSETDIIPVGYPEVMPEPRTDKDFDEEKIHKEKW